MKSIKVDFNNRSKSGLVRGSLERAGDVFAGEWVQIEDSEEDLRFMAMVVELNREKGRVFFQPRWTNARIKVSPEASSYVPSNKLFKITTKQLSPFLIAN